MNEIKSKHIDLAQSIITRMAQNSFVIKGWMITIVVGLFVFLQNDNYKNNFLIYLFPIIGFCLDQDQLGSRSTITIDNLVIIFTTQCTVQQQI